LVPYSYLKVPPTVLRTVTCAPHNLLMLPRYLGVKLNFDFCPVHPPPQSSSYPGYTTLRPLDRHSPAPAPAAVIQLLSTVIYIAHSLFPLYFISLWLYLAPITTTAPALACPIRLDALRRLVPVPVPARPRPRRFQLPPPFLLCLNP
jgi:hypothetical protein